MKRVTVTIKPEVDLYFRKKASQRFKFERGWYSKAICEAMEMWMDKGQSEEIKNSIYNFPRLMGSHLWNTIKEESNINSEDPHKFMEELIKFVYGAGSRNEINYQIVDNEIIINFPQDYPENPEYHIMHLYILVVTARAALEERQSMKYHIRGLEKIKEVKISKD